MVNRFGVIVDGYSTGAGLAKRFAEYGISCIHVQSQPIIPKVYKHTYVQNDYVAHYISFNNPQSLVNELEQYSPEFVIPGAECGIELADNLSERLHLPSNGTQLSAHRRNKYLMWQAVAATGLDVIPSFLAKTLSEALIWAIAQNTWPLIVKPLTSAGGEGVRICQNIAELSSAFSDVAAIKTNMLGFKNSGALLQHCIAGKEYVVNTVSYAGNHKFCELWEYTRYQLDTGQQIYDTARAIPFDPQEHGDIIDYAVHAIDALGIRYGAAHVEIIKNTTGCYLIEIGARMMGANLPFALLEKSISTPQAQYNVMAYADPKEFMRSITNEYRINHPFAAVFMISKKTGTISTIDFIDKIQALTSFYDMKLAVKVGDMLHKTIDYQTSPGMIYLSHDNWATIENDIKNIRALEEKMFFIETEAEVLKVALG